MSRKAHGSSIDDRASRVQVSSFCSGGDCVGVAWTADGVEIVDTKGATPALRFDRSEWAAFVAGVKNGEFDVPARHLDV